MNFPFQLPLIAEDFSSEEPPLPIGSAAADNRLQQLSEKWLRLVSNGVNMILAPTDIRTEHNQDDVGKDEDYFEAIERLTEAAASTKNKRTIVGAVLSPDTALIDYDCGAFESAHLSCMEKMTLLKNAGADFILLKDSTRLWSMRAAVLAAKTVGIPIFVTMTVDADGKTTSEADYTAALITLQSLGASAFGISCTDGGTSLAKLLRHLFPHAEIPLIACAELSDKETVKTLTFSGASVFIDNKNDITDEIISAVISNGSIFEEKTEKDSMAAAVESEAFFLPDDLVLSSPVDCGYDMAEDLIDLDDENINSILVRLYSSDDASFLADEGGFSRLPVAVNSNDMTTLEAALRYFPGRLIIDSHCDLKREELNTLARKYGAILY